MDNNGMIDGSSSSLVTDLLLFCGFLFIEMQIINSDIAGFKK